MSTHRMSTRTKSKIPELPTDLWEHIFSYNYTPDTAKFLERWQELPPKVCNIPMFLPIRQLPRSVDQSTRVVRKNLDMRIHDIACDYVCDNMDNRSDAQDFRKALAVTLLTITQAYDVYKYERRTEMTQCGFCGFSDQDLGCMCDESRWSDLCWNCGLNSRFCVCGAGPCDSEDSDPW